MYTKRIKILWNINYIGMRRKISMTFGCDIWMICLKLNRFFTITVEYCNFLNLYELKYKSFLTIFLTTTDRSKNGSDQKHYFSPSSYTPFYFLRTLPLILMFTGKHCTRFQFRYQYKIRSYHIFMSSLIIIILTYIWIETARFHIGR